MLPTSTSYEPVNCAQLVELVTEWMDDALPLARKQDVEEHLAICPGCVAYVGQVRSTVGVLARLAETPPEPVATPARDHVLAAFRSWRAERGTV